MPIVYKQHINQFTQLAVWHITEAPNFFARIPLQRQILNEQKRLQHLAGRQLLLALQPNFPLSNILVADSKKPFLEDEAYHFSISHACTFAAAIISTQNRVGVDVEVCASKALRVLPKFLSPTEQSLLPLSNDDAFATLFWSVKEAVYKWNGALGIDFIRDMPITKIQGTKDEGTVFCNFKNQHLLAVQYKLLQQQLYICHVLT
jgi:phosphopantetheinyl transferase